MGNDTVAVNVMVFQGFSAIAILFLAMAFGFKMTGLRKKQRCSKVVKGKVVSYSAVSKSSAYVRLPIVEYEVDGEKYRITGPQYNYTTVTVSSPFIKETTQEYTTDLYSQVFRVKIKRNAFFSSLKNPMATLFPLGSEIDVFYDPDKPRRAYVLRLLDNKGIVTIFSLLGVLMLAVAIVGYFVF